MKILVLGSGAREHALVWKLSQSPAVEEIHCIPGNGGICQQARCASLSLNRFDELIRYVREQGIQLTVVGPEQPLVGGIADAFQAAGLAIFGPNRRAAQLEGSKIFAKQLMARYGIPTAHFASFDSLEAALGYLNRLPDGPVVVKADGLAAGKGSVVCSTLAEARRAVQAMMGERIFQEAGSRVVIEEFMEGEEASLFVLCDGKDYRLLVPAQDFKRALDDDRGKNTGGMGAYAPTPFVTPEVLRAARTRIVEPTLEALQREGIDYRGVLYCGLMLTREGPRVVEFNCRFGDPETQVVLPLLKSDLVDLVMAVVEQRLGATPIALEDAWAVCVVLASGGYPDQYQTGFPIQGLKEVPEDVLVFHAGTRRQEGRLVTAGGRVLSVVARAARLSQAVERAYQAVENIQFQNRHFRRDIARRACRWLENAAGTSRTP